ncbi:hypothetical protein TNIN_164631 [Trichonephila inaurata madagascariensis]|uniref:Uncharacterized protein n=1 Tax=Trichonephila inaurata madagascariensis TaxID=2747483 RepID=A0A8X6IDW1_9ARAC|nr:hypothetical protein TNIN_164631 [Trichonephila inaurata madagascariensis]
MCARNLYKEILSGRARMEEKRENQPMGDEGLETKRTVRGKREKSCPEAESARRSLEDAGRRYLLLLEDGEERKLCVWDVHSGQSIE